MNRNECKKNKIVGILNDKQNLNHYFIVSEQNY